MEAVSDSLHLDPGKGIKGSSGEWYRIQQLLGAGGNAVTYLVTCTSGRNKGVPFALKFFRRLSMPERRDAFIEEVAFLKSADHPAIMRTFDDGLFDFEVNGVRQTYPFLVAEYLPRTLFQVMRAGTSSITEKLAFATQLLSALVYLDAQDPPVVHRDIKPQNIFVKGRACVLGDFGLLKILDGHDEFDRDVFKESVGIGMPYYYRTPDLVAYAKQEAPLTTKTDIFQLGLVLAELFTGRNPCPRPPAADPLAPIELEKLGTIRSSASGLIVIPLFDMLVADPPSRPSAAEVIDRWTSAFDTVAAQSMDLGGTVF